MGVVGFAERTLVAPGWLRRRAAPRVTDRGLQLIAEAQAGDKAAFDALVGPLMDPAFRLACGILARVQQRPVVSPSPRMGPALRSAYGRLVLSRLPRLLYCGNGFHTLADGGAGALERRVAAPEDAGGGFN
jgi:hypothetical protein